MTKSGAPNTGNCHTRVHPLRQWLPNQTEGDYGPNEQTQQTWDRGERLLTFLIGTCNLFKPKQLAVKFLLSPCVSCLYRQSDCYLTWIQAFNVFNWGNRVLRWGGSGGDVQWSSMWAIGGHTGGGGCTDPLTSVLSGQRLSQAFCW